MKNKIILLFIIIIFACGCDKQTSFTCEILDTKITITLRNGKVVNYFDEIKGNASESDINELNEMHLRNTNDNKSAMDILKEVIKSNGGNCNSEG